MEQFTGNKTDMTFKLNYIIDDQYYRANQSNPPPILFYCGNEALVKHWHRTTGYQGYTLAQKYGAVSVYGEHRFFGNSKPFGDKSMNPENTQFLNVKNTLMDYANLIQHVRKMYGLQKSTTIVFGGSYGGMLATWMRMKFPSVV